MSYVNAIRPSLNCGLFLNRIQFLRAQCWQRWNNWHFYPKVADFASCQINIRLIRISLVSFQIFENFKIIKKYLELHQSVNAQVKCYLQHKLPQVNFSSKFVWDAYHMRHMYHVDLKKRGDLGNSLVLLGVTLLLHVAHWVSRAPPHNTLPAFLNLNGTSKN